MNRRTPDKKNKRTPLKLILIVGAIVLMTQVSTLIFSPHPEKDAWGKIILPRAGDSIENGIIIVGETQDIASGQFIWIVIESVNRPCYPLKRVLQNTRFRSTVRPTQLPESFNLSIFVVDETTHKQWSEWITQPADSVVRCPALNRRLDTVELKL